MKDIDFDELDRAVGSVLGGSANGQADQAVTTSAPAAVAAPAPAVVSSVPTPESKDGQDAAEVPASPAPTIQPLASPARKRGQFLDMVHPSADMRKANAAPATIRKKISPITPTGADTTKVEDVSPAPESDETNAFTPVDEADSSPVMPPIDASTEAPDTLSSLDSDDTSGPSAPAWPDPIDVANNEPEQETPTEETANESDTAQGDETANSTPFVPGVEVEKRPLGGNADAPTEATTTEEPSSYDSAASPAHSEITPDLSGPEFSQEINSIESNDVASSDDKDTADSSESKETEEVKTDEPAVAPAPTAVETAPAAAVSNPSIAQSIPQQYTSSAQTTNDDEGDEENHPLFDAEEYHQPLIPAHTKTRGKGVFIVVLFLILALVGAGIGYLAFSMGL